MIQKEVEKIWLIITNARLTGNQVEVQVQGDANADRDGTWLPCTQDKPDSEKLYDIVQNALQNGKKTSGLLTFDCDRNELKIEEVRVQYQ